VTRIEFLPSSHWGVIVQNQNLLFSRLVRPTDDLWQALPLMQGSGEGSGIQNMSTDTIIMEIVYNLWFDISVYKVPVP
jgi:hypothetical protein